MLCRSAYLKPPPKKLNALEQNLGRKITIIKNSSPAEKNI
jgi:hypothetical protein